MPSCNEAANCLKKLRKFVAASSHAEDGHFLAICTLDNLLSKEVTCSSRKTQKRITYFFIVKLMYM